MLDLLAPGLGTGWSETQNNTKEQAVCSARGPWPEINERQEYFRYGIWISMSLLSTSYTLDPRLLNPHHTRVNGRIGLRTLFEATAKVYRRRLTMLPAHAQDLSPFPP